ncbi:hypothetical protein [Streptomyces sp. N35]|uniref:hypothetical protein n=1 Tax=Streptomyces sp. N35 TaxID=2795730 RepID=UPI0018F491E5|nr:hypothetical protein [Streptomyces sp. N35]
MARAVLFDRDGTLVHTSHLHTTVWWELFGGWGMSGGALAGRPLCDLPPHPPRLPGPVQRRGAGAGMPLPRLEMSH